MLMDENNNEKENDATESLVNRLYKACKLKDVMSVENLLKSGVDITHTSKRGESILGSAVLGMFLTKRDRQIVDLLLEHGCQLDGLYREYYNFCKSIIKGDIETFEDILKKLESVDFDRIRGETPLYFAVVANRLPMVKALVDKKKARIDNRLLLNKFSVLPVAISRNSYKIVKYLLSCKTCSVNCVVSFDKYEKVSIIDCIKIERYQYGSV